MPDPHDAETAPGPDAGSRPSGPPEKEGVRDGTGAPDTRIRTAAVIAGFLLGILLTVVAFFLGIGVAGAGAVAIGVVLALPLLLGVGLTFGGRSRGLGIGMLVSCGALWLLLIGPCLAMLSG